MPRGQTDRRRPLPARVLRVVVSVLFWTGVLVLGLFGTYFSFTNYPAFGIVAAVVVLLGLAYAERKRRLRQMASERARRRSRARSHDLLDG